MDGNIKDTPPIIVGAAGRGPRRGGTRCEASWPTLAGKIDARKTAARPEFDAWLAAATPERSPANVPTDGLAVARAARRRRRARRRPCQSTAQTASVDRRRRLRVGTPGRVGDKALSASSRRRPSRSPTPATSKRDQAFTCRRLGQARRATDQPARSSPAWTTRNDYRGWDLWVEGGGVGTHIVNKWPDDALKVVARRRCKPKQVDARRRHLRRLGEGGGREGLRRRRSRSRRPSQADKLKGTIRTHVPFKIGQRHTQRTLCRR